MLDLWTKTSGTLINVATVLIGTGIGLLLRNRLPQAMRQIITQAIGLLTLYIGVTMANSLASVKGGNIDGIILGLLALVIGGILGEWAQIEQRLNQLGDRLKKQFRGGGRFTEGFVAASLLFCVGPLTVIGSLNNGLNGDNTLLTIKSTMDGFAAAALTGSYGMGVGFSALVVLVFQGGISLLAGGLVQVLPDPANNPSILLATGVGGIMILGLGLNLLEIAKVRVASFLPALVLAPLIYAIAVWLS
ncbi:MAG: DUF554 domain-containing protein [Cyanobacteria bacterium P01_A01_bin.123]